MAHIRSWFGRLRSLVSGGRGAHAPLNADRRGSTMVEFGLMSVPLIGMLFAFMEILLIAATDVMLDSAAEEANRALYTGNAQNSDMTDTEFKQEICRLAVLTSCGKNLLVDLRAFDSWADISLPNLVDADGNFLVSPTPSGAEVPGNPEQIMVIRIVARREPVIPGLSLLFRNGLADAVIIKSSQVFVIEPYK